MVEMRGERILRRLEALIAAADNMEIGWMW
jgi:hypothetical protein